MLQVCIAALKRHGKKKKYFAMKYVNKKKCLAKNALHNVLREIDLMSTLSHPMLVNLWYTFQVCCTSSTISEACE